MGDELPEQQTHSACAGSEPRSAPVGSRHVLIPYRPLRGQRQCVRRRQNAVSRLEEQGVRGLGFRAVEPAQPRMCGHIHQGQPN